MAISEPTKKITPKLMHSFACHDNPYDNTAKSMLPVISKTMPTKARKIKKKEVIITRLFQVALLVCFICSFLFVINYKIKLKLNKIY